VANCYDGCDVPGRPSTYQRSLPSASLPLPLVSAVIALIGHAFARGQAVPRGSSPLAALPPGGHGAGLRIRSSGAGAE